MLKKIVFTLLVILLVFLVVRWRQKKATQVQAAGEVDAQGSPAIYYLAGAVITLGLVGLMLWLVIP